MDTPKDRLNKAYKELVYRNIVENKKGLSVLLGLDESYTSQMFTGRKQITSGFSQTLCDKTGVNPEWLLTGKGDMFKPHTTILSDEEHDQEHEKQHGSSPTRTTGDDIRAQKAFGEKENKGVIYVPIPAHAGYSKHYYEPLFVEKLNRYPFPLPYEGDRYRVFQIKGHSMEFYNKENKPDGLFEGMDIVCELVDPDDWKRGQIAPYHIYVIVTEDEILAKRILIKPNGEYVLHSDNPDEKPRQRGLRKEDIRELWYVKRKVDWDLAPPEKIDIEI